MLREKDASLGNSMLNHAGHACHPYIMDFLEIFTSGKYDRDMKILKILACNSKWFRVCGILKNRQFDDDRVEGLPNTNFSKTTSF